MTYGMIVRVPAPIEAYDASHAEIMRSLHGGSAEGLVVHIARATNEGFEVLEVWESKEQADRFSREIVGPALERIGVPATAPQPEFEEFEPRTVLVTP